MTGGALLDIDGVLTVSWRPVPGAVETIGWLQDQDIDFRLVTNTSSKSRREIADLLSKAGMRIEVSRILTAVTSAASHLVETYPGKRCFVVNEGDLEGDLLGVDIVDAKTADVVLLGGAGVSTGYAELDATFRLAAEGVPIIALHRNTRYQTADGPALDMGAFIVGLEAAADIEIPIVGKPAAAFFNAALIDLGSSADETVMVGDDLVSDVLGAQAVGLTGVLVKTGKFRPADLADHGGQPDLVIESIAQLPEVLQRMHSQEHDPSLPPLT
jgi:HAD superfamily hydrolase (TIGR01458 family)